MTIRPHKIARYIISGRDIVLLIYRRFINEGCTRIAASLSYTSLLALVPVLSVTLAILSGFKAFDGARENIHLLIFSNFAPHLGDQARDLIATFVDNATKLTALGIGGIAVTAILLLATIENTLNDIFRVKEKRLWGSRLMRFWTVLTITPVLLAISLSLSRQWQGVAIPSTISAVIKAASPFLVATVFFSLLFIVIPHCRIKLRYIVIGAIVSSTGFTILKSLFTFYVSSGSYATLYGAMAGVPLFLIWMYCAWNVVLLGALVTDTLRRR